MKTIILVFLLALVAGCSREGAPVVKCEDWELYEVIKQGRYNSWKEVEPRCTSWSVNGILKPVNKLP
jgi:hypothetical protein